jgi:hypothetical protein
MGTRPDFTAAKSAPTGASTTRRIYVLHTTSLFNWVDRIDAHPIVHPDDNVPEQLANSVRIAILSDWATGLYGLL